LLDLLGDRKQPPFFGGLPSWDSAVSTRRIFFLAGSTVGCDGMHDSKGFYTLQSLSHFALFNEAMNAARVKAVADPVEKEAVSDSIHALVRMQTAIIPRDMGAQPFGK
jgi:hypothetical protein